MNTTNSTYNPTLMQKLLGRNYKWWYSIIYYFKLSYQYRLQLIIAFVRFFIPLFVSYIVINTTSNNSSVNQYILAASVFYQIFAFVIGPSFDIANHVISGKFVIYQLRPTNYFMTLICHILGFNFVLLFARIFAIVIAAYLLNGVNLMSISIFQYLTLLPYIILILVIGFILEVILGGIVFFQHQTTKNIIPFIFDLMPFLAGSIISFDLSKNLEFLKYTPFSYYAYHPMQIYLDNYNSTQTLLVFLGGITWCLILYFLAKFVFKLGLKRNESVGL